MPDVLGEFVLDVRTECETERKPQVLRLKLLS